MLEYFLPIELAVLGVDDQPIEAEGRCHLGNGGRFQGHPQAEDRFVGRQLIPELSQGGCLHAKVGIISKPNARPLP